MKKEHAMASRQDVEILICALMQEGWQIEGAAADGVAPKMLDILESRFEGYVLILTVRPESGQPVELRGKIGRVLLQGDFGQGMNEPRRFAISFQNLSDAQRRQAAGTTGFWRKLEPGGIGLIFVRDEDAPPGWPERNGVGATYGFTEHLRRYGNGDNLLRTPHVAQPQALKVGDVLATGDRVLSPPRSGYNGSVLIHLTGGLKGHWIKVAARIPLALLAEGDDVPAELWGKR